MRYTADAFAQVWLISVLVAFTPASAVAKEPARAKLQDNETPQAEATASKGGSSSDGKSDGKTPVDELTVTKHETTIGGVPIRYTATAGTMVIKTNDDTTKPKASMFFVAYTRDDDNETAQRPLTFCFNGGPGSAAVWLHLGMLGPWHVPLNDDAVLSPGPHQLKPNPHSLLDQTDLVFIDPVNTGYSRPAAGEDKNQFHGFDEDIASVGEFVHLYTTRYDRWASPRFLIGESYGTLRAAGLAGHLQDRYNMELNGMVLVSTVLDFRTINFGENNDLPYLTYLPTYTATAWYHKRLPANLQSHDLCEVVDEASDFALNEYALALLKGDALADKERDRVVQKLASYTGLTPDFIDRANLRIGEFQFAKQLLRDQHARLSVVSTPALRASTTTQLRNATAMIPANPRFLVRIRPACTSTCVKT